MELAVLGWPPDGPQLRLDHERFSYAGKFVMTSTGKGVARTTDGELVGAIAFNEDRTDGDTLWLRYVTVRDDYRGEGVGPRLAAFVAGRAFERGYDLLRIAVNNPFAYQALYKSGFGYTGEETGIAELVLACPPPDDRSRARYQAGLDRFRRRDLSAPETSFLAEHTGDPPDPIDASATT